LSADSNTEVVAVTEATTDIVVDDMTSSDISSKASSALPESTDAQFNRRELDFVACKGDYVIVYMEEDTEGYRFWVAEAQEPISYEANKRKKAGVKYYAARGRSNYLTFEIESSKTVKLPYKMLIGSMDKSKLKQNSDHSFTITEDERDRWSGIAKMLDKE
tara:strand:+ start:2469 stop:2951 length:483 start_codon:yes stop_codon:yes gene_type:complete